MTQAVIAPEAHWYRLLSKSQWRTLIAANLGWMFDGYETYAVLLSVGAALRQLLDPSQYSQIAAYAGLVIAMTLLGWGIGGLIGGVVADYLGRKRTMIPLTSRHDGGVVQLTGSVIENPHPHLNTFRFSPKARQIVCSKIIGRPQTRQMTSFVDV